MPDLTSLAEYGPIGVVICSMILLGYLVNKFLDVHQKTTEANAKAFLSLEAAIHANTQVTQQTYEYLKLRNGSLDKTLNGFDRQLESFSAALRDVR